jgi:hypothetical protein
MSVRGTVLRGGGGLGVTRLAAGLVVVCVVLLGCVGSAVAAAPVAGPRLSLHTLASPTDFSAGDTVECLHVGGSLPPCDAFQVTATNLGDAVAAGPVVLTDALPAGLTQLFFRFDIARNQTALEGEGPQGEPVEEAGEGKCEAGATSVRCEFTGELQPDQRLEMKIYVTVEEHAASALNHATVAENGLVVATSDQDDVISPVAPVFEATAFLSQLTAVNGAEDAMAGDHPYELVTRFDASSKIGLTPEGTLLATNVGDGVRDVVVDLPPGVVGSAQAAPKCSFAQLQSYPQSCPKDTLVGHVTTEPGEQGDVANSPVFNMVPERGVVAEFGFDDVLFNSHAIVAGVAPTPDGYVVRAVAHELPDINISNAITTLYGNPAAKNGGGATPGAMFTNSSDCSGEPLQSTLFMDSWEHPGTFNPDGTPKLPGEEGSAGWASATTQSPPVTGCEDLRFQPQAFSVQPDTSKGDSPTGLSFELSVAQSEQPGTLATPPLRDASVALPAGMTLDPSSANGLEACSEAQIGWDGRVSEANAGLTNFNAAAPACPEASKVGEVHVSSPLISSELVGAVYLARQYENPYGSLLAAYIVIDDPTTGLIVKIPGKLVTNPETGQITGVFDENPQFPFSQLKLRFFGGSEGELATPQACGTYRTTSELLPWSSTPGSGPTADPSSSFQISSNCSFAFAPSFSAGTVSNEAGSFSPLSLTIARQDGEQHLSGLTVTTPPGLLGSLTGVPLCGEAQANAGSCSAASLIGETTVAAGVGPTPYVVHGGRVYLTGPYNGGPFGLSVVVPAVAGPFNLGNVVVRSSIRVSPVTSQITVVSDPLPQMINSVEGLKSGIPADIRTVNVTINRPDFTLNPTSCAPLAVTGSVTGAQGTTTPVSDAFQAAGCQSLKFTPSLTATAAGHASKADGQSLAFKISYPKGAQGTQSWFNETKFDLPKQLPARLTTIQKACVAATFEADPADCPAESLIGSATVHTPVVPVALTGPLYFVSFANKKFPDAILVLQGYGITVQLTGETFIDHTTGVTSVTFQGLPDVPFENVEVSVPSGPYSEFGSNLPHESYDFCGQKLVMPTLLKASNGLEIHQNTKIAVTGCPKVKAKKVRKRHKAKKGHKAKGSAKRVRRVS